MPSKTEFYRQMAEQVSTQLVGSWKEWTAFLSQSVGEINREFARNGLLVTRINDSEENLEDYFSKLIGGGGIA